MRSTRVKVSIWQEEEGKVWEMNTNEGRRKNSCEGKAGIMGRKGQRKG